MSSAQNESAPEIRGAPSDRIDRVRRQAAFCCSTTVGLVAADRDLARLLGLGDFAHEVDVQETVLERRALHLDVVGELEYALERARGDALVERRALGLVGLGLLVAADRQGVFLDLDVELALGKARDRNRDAIVVLAGPLDVVGRITGRAVAELVEEGKQPVEADGRTIEGSKIESSHSKSSLSDMQWSTRSGSDRGSCSRMACTALM